MLKNKVILALRDGCWRSPRVTFAESPGGRAAGQVGGEHPRACPAAVAFPALPSHIVPPISPPSHTRISRTCF